MIKELSLKRQTQSSSISRDYFARDYDYPAVARYRFSPRADLVGRPRTAGRLCARRLYWRHVFVKESLSRPKIMAYVQTSQRSPSRTRRISEFVGSGELSVRSRASDGPCATGMAAKSASGSTSESSNRLEVRRSSAKSPGLAGPKRARDRAEKVWAGICLC